MGFTNDWCAPKLTILFPTTPWLLWHLSRSGKEERCRCITLSVLCP